MHDQTQLRPCVFILLLFPVCCFYTFPAFFPEMKEIRGREDDQFHMRISDIMKQIEDRMKSSEHADELIEDQQQNVLLAPRDHGSDRYTQWINGLEKPIARLYDQKSRRFFVSCQRHLMVGVFASHK